MTSEGHRSYIVHPLTVADLRRRQKGAMAPLREETAKMLRLWLMSLNNDTIAS